MGKYVDGKPLTAAELNETDDNATAAAGAVGNAATPAELASVVAQGIKNNADAQKNVTFGAGTAAELASVVAGQSVGNVSWSSDLSEYRDIIIAAVKKGKFGFNCASGSVTNHPEGGRIFFFMSQYNKNATSNKVVHGIFSYYDRGSYVFTAYLNTSGEVASLKISNVIAWA